MASNNFYFRGIQVSIEKSASNTFNHFAFFIDLHQGKLAPPLATWSYVNIGTPDEPSYQFQATIECQPNPEDGDDVRTFYIGSCFVNQSADSTPIPTGVNAAKLTVTASTNPNHAQDEIVCTGDPSSRRPPIIKFSSNSLSNWQGAGMGILSALRDQPSSPPPLTSILPNTKHTQVDHFAFMYFKVTENYSNEITNITSDGTVLTCTPSPRTKINQNQVVAVGLFDCNLNSDGTKNNNLSLNIPTAFKVGGIATAQPSIPIIWSEL